MLGLVLLNGKKNSQRTVLTKDDKASSKMWGNFPIGREMLANPGDLVSKEDPFRRTLKIRPQVSKTSCMRIIIPTVPFGKAEAHKDPNSFPSSKIKTTRFRQTIA